MAFLNNKIFRCHPYGAICDDRSFFSSEKILYKVSIVQQLLQKKLVMPGDIVAVYGDRSIDLVISILAILDYGAIYLPIAKDTPINIASYMLKNSCASWVLCDDEIMVCEIADGQEIISLNMIAEEENLHKNKKINISFSRKIKNNSVIAVFYTSGSTGNPKGVRISCGNLMNRLDWMQSLYPYTRQDQCIMKTSISFVDSLAEILSPLLLGATLHLPAPRLERDITTFVDFLVVKKISRAVFVPSYLCLVMESVKNLALLVHLKVYVLSGEELSKDLAEKIISQTSSTLINIYGSTEVTADVLYHEVKKSDLNKSSIPLGQPISNCCVYVVSPSGKLAKANEVGELVITGKPLTLGYLSKSKEMSKPDFSLLKIGTQQVPAYYTNDLGYFDQENIFYFSGRKDSMVKINGKKVFTNQVKALIEHADNIRHCQVISCQYRDENMLVALVIADNFSRKNCVQGLSELIPEHMIPSLFIEMNQFPKLSNGKIDRPSLQKICLREIKLLKTDDYRNESDVIIRTICEVLNLSKIEPDENFLNYGLNSLKLARLAVELSNNLSRAISLAEVSTYNSASTLKNFLDLSCEKNSLTTPQMMKISNCEEGENLFLIHPITGSAIPYSKLRNHLEEFNLWGISNPYFSTSKFSTLIDMASFYKDMIINSGAKEPFTILGWSFGGVVALEIANQLYKEGFSVKKLIMVDSFNIYDVLSKQRSSGLLSQEIKKEINWLYQREGMFSDSAECEAMEKEVRYNSKLLFEYQPSSEIRELNLIKALKIESKKYPLGKDKFNGWSSCFKEENITVFPIDATHDELFSLVNVANVSELLKQILITNIREGRK